MDRPVIAVLVNGLPLHRADTTRPVDEMCADAGFHAREHRIVREAFPVRDAQHYWELEHVPRLPGLRRVPRAGAGGEFRDRMFAGLRELESSGGIAVEATIAFNRFAS